MKTVNIMKTIPRRNCMPPKPLQNTTTTTKLAPPRCNDTPTKLPNRRGPGKLQSALKCQPLILSMIPKAKCQKPEFSSTFRLKDKFCNKGQEVRTHRSTQKPVYDDQKERETTSLKISSRGAKRTRMMTERPNLTQLIDL